MKKKKEKKKEKDEKNNNENNERYILNRPVTYAVSKIIVDCPGVIYDFR
jgi:hypothetical protein